MGTVNLTLAKEIADADGYYMDDPRVERIVEYTDISGKQAFGLEYAHQLGKYAASEFIRDPKVYWQAPTQDR